MKCPKCKIKTKVIRVYPETDKGVVTRHHRCPNCGVEFFTDQSRT